MTSENDVEHVVEEQSYNQPSFFFGVIANG